ncbi:MAG: sensor histidine kinase [Acidimicrobiia bacterium]
MAIESARPGGIRSIWGVAHSGQLAVVAGLVAIGAVLTIGFVVGRTAREDLLNARTAIHHGVVTDLVDQGLIPIRPNDARAIAALDNAIRLRLLGGETIRVKLWSPEGQVLYSDASELIGRSFEVDNGIATALAGGSTVEVDDLAGIENESEQGIGEPLLEFYLPVVADGEIVGAFEVYEVANSFLTSLARIRSQVWTAVSVGLGALVVAFGSVSIRLAQGLDRRRREAEQHLAELLTAAEDERRRIVGSLHDDIGQPLYRIQYGLEGCLQHLDDGEVASELRRLVELVSGIDSSLRSELRVLYSGLVEGDGLADALDRLADATRFEGGLEVEVTGGEVAGVSGTAATALFRATQEAVINARKHAQASKITIDLRGGPGRAVVTVSDNGRGWNGRIGIGLATTHQRLVALNGSMRIERRGNRGTRVFVSVPTASSGDTS